MDPRVALLREFYRGLPKDRAKLETRAHGFAYLDRLLADGMELEYGELTLSGVLHKYKLRRIPERRMDELLHAHVAQTCNVCLYFGEPANDLFCFNLDNNERDGGGAANPETERAVRILTEKLGALGCEPLVVASGRGYHLWGRLGGAVANERLYDFMLRAAVVTAAELHREGSDHHRVKFNFYPDPRTRDVVSLRLFGSVHARNGVFSRVLAPDGLRDEAGSWEFFSAYLGRTIPLPAFESACRALREATPA